MPIGPLVRQMLGPLERPISNIYRGLFINLDTLVQQINAQFYLASFGRIAFLIQK